MTTPVRFVPRTLLLSLVLALSQGGGSGLLRAQDSVRDTAGRDARGSTEAHAAQLDSLRQRVAELRADLLRLRIEYGIRLDRQASGLRFRIPGDSAAVRDALPRVASLLRRHYPEARVRVLARARGPGEACGSSAQRRRTRRVIERLVGPKGVEASRIGAADCGRRGRTQPDEGDAGADPSPIVLFVEWGPPRGGTT